MSNKDKPDAKPAQTFSLLPKIINGGIAGMVGVSMVFPIDLVKTRLQNQPVGPNGEKQYTSIADCFKKTFKAEGLFGMYRGAAVNIALVTPEKAVKLAANDMFRYYLTKADGSLPLFRQMMAGGAAGACQIVITTPMELLKIQLQDAGRISSQAKAEGRTVEKLTAMKITKQLMKERGILGLYRGVGATAGRDISFSIIYFPLFAILNDLGPKNPITKQAEFWWSFVSGFTAGSASSVCVTPMDVVKTRMQTIAKGAGEKQYNNILECITTTFKHEGIRAFFKGGFCRAMVVAPLFGIAQAVYYLGVAEKLLGIKK